MQSTGLMMLWFLVVLALIPVSLWLLKRSGWTPKSVAAQSPWPMKTLGQLPLGPGQRVVTIEVGSGADKTCLVLGVTANSITTLHHIQPGSKPDFGQVLQQSQASQSLQGAQSTMKGL
jgi:flagellar protein FliO/FliZ